MQGLMCVRVCCVSGKYNVAVKRGQPTDWDEHRLGDFPSQKKRHQATNKRKTINCFFTCLSTRLGSEKGNNGETTVNNKLV